MKKPKIVLITPPYHSGVVESAGTWLNLGFVTIAGALRARGFEVDYYDAMSLWHDWPEIRARIEDFAPDVVATTAFTASVVDAVKLLGLAKEIDPETVTVLGNVHATFCYEELLTTESCIDYIVRGEGEHTLPDLLECLNAGDDPARVAGLAFPREGLVVVTAGAAMIENLDVLEPAWDLVDWPIYSYYPKKNSTLAIVSSSRGCRQNCSFCSQQLFWQRTWRARSPENFVNELELLRDLSRRYIGTGALKRAIELAINAIPGMMNTIQAPYAGWRQQPKIPVVTSLPALYARVTAITATTKKGMPIKRNARPATRRTSSGTPSKFKSGVKYLVRTNAARQ